jgi:hypothetical protein
MSRVGIECGDNSFTETILELLQSSELGDEEYSLEWRKSEVMTVELRLIRKIYQFATLFLVAHATWPQPSR